MADNKGGSDLDVFEGLAKKSTRSANPGLAPPPPSNQPRKTTLVGGMAPLTPPRSAPPSALPAGPLPPPSAPPPKPLGTLPGIARATPPPGSHPPSRLTPPPPPAARLPLPTPPPAPAHAHTGTLPMPTSPLGGNTPLPGTIPALPPPPVPPPGGLPAKKGHGAGKASVDMDWDDDASTHVFDKQRNDTGPSSTQPGAGPVTAPRVSAAAALLASSGGAAPAVRTAATTATPVAAAASAQPSQRDEQTAPRQRAVVPAAAAGGSRAGVILGGLSLIVVIALAVFVLLPKKGHLQVVVTAPGGATVGKVEIFVNGQKKCDTTPCLVKDLEPGSTIIKGIAPDYPPAEVSVNVEVNKEKMVPLELKGAGGALAGAGALPAGATELKIASVDAQKGVKVSVDGTDKGTLPVELRDLSPGSHKLKFDGGERYDKLEQSVDLSAGQSKDLGAIKLKVLKGQVTLELATAGANVTLVRQGSDNKKVEKKLPDLSKAPVTMEIDPTENWKLVASKKGFQEFTQELNFEDGQAEKKIKIELSAESKAGDGAAKGTPAGGPGPGPGPGPSEPKEPKEPAPAVASGTGSLNINSIPVSKVVLDGKPLGSTPKVGVSVPAGSHTVTFIHPDLGKKSVTVQVKAGETKTAAVKFK
jgi:hypothetical protein